MEKLRVVIADDHEEIRNYLVTLLCREFHVVGAAANGDELVQMATWMQPHVIVSDISMPGMDGLEARNELIAQGKLIPFVFVSAHGKEILHLLPKANSIALVHKTEIARHVFHAIDAVLREDVYRSPFYME